MNSRSNSSTYERLIQEDPQFKVDLDEQYKELVLSELLIALMEQEHISVRKLALLHKSV